jgi:hypothetical protein
MSKRESGEYENDAKDRPLHPFWEEYHFPSSDGADGSKKSFYFNPFTGSFTLDTPHISGDGCLGGILADEMVLKHN